MKKILAVFLCLAAVACARPPAQEPGGDSGDALAGRWRAMLDYTGIAGPFRDQLSLRFGREGDTRRVTAILWGNDDKNLRLDVMAGVGAIVAKIQEDGQNFLLYAPRAGKAYFHQGVARPLLKIGVPVPFDLSRFAALLNGHFGEVFGDAHLGASINGAGLAEYEIDGQFPGLLSLDENGLPVNWRQKKGGWSLALAYDDSRPNLPHSLRLANANGQRAIILMKEREDPAAPFGEGQMKLALPEGVPLLPLSKFRTPASGAFGE